LANEQVAEAVARVFTFAARDRDRQRVAHLAIARGLAVGCAAVPVIYRTRKEARKIDDDQRRTAGIVPGRLFESCP
jgi:hypothetical protein